ncbi:MAG TPA: GAF domain-containing sensor histidine kinase [Polyangiaceae bacterium]|nr:GAF domain-containing sensor histidine kinase [Polyangiaceae bacterium]
MAPPVTLRIAHETARLALARIQLNGDETRASATRKATEISARALQVERVGVWVFRDGGASLACLSQYTLSRREHVRGEALDLSPFPVYAAALRERRVLAAAAAREHPLTRELASGYFARHGISSVLDAPLIRDGTVVGVVCHEHVGPPRRWDQKEIDFAGTVADMVAMLFEQADKIELQAALQAERERHLAEVKMDALERLARTVAHDVNNLLTAAGLSADALGHHPDPRVAAYADQIAAAVRSGARIVRQLSEFSGASPERTRADAAEVLARLEPALRSLAGKGVELRVSITAAKALVACPAEQLEQLVLNLCANARDALEGRGGTIRVSLAEAGAAGGGAGWVALEVADDGCGMSEATQARMFEPYFSTKGPGRGVGLSAVYGVARRAGGALHVDSAPGAGTRITVLLPRAEAEPPPEDAPWSVPF